MGSIMQLELTHVVGWALTVLALVSGMIVRDRYIQDKIASGDNSTRDQSALAFDKLHTRINDIKDHYVRRDDLANHLERIDESIKGLRDEQRENNKIVLTAIAGGAARRGG